MAKTPSSEVYAATQVGAEGFERPVAIKLLSSEAAAEPTAAERFAHEARAMAQLRHPNILAVLDFVVLEGRGAQVLERVEGLSAEALLHHLPERRLPPPQAVWITLEVLRGLDYAHHTATSSGARLLSHRDLSTHNVLLSDRGEVKLADFGVASWSRGTQTAVGVARGTLAFMAPEQMRGDPVDVRTDVFGVGCLLHALLRGVSPLESVAVREALLAGTPIDLDPQLPSGLRSVLTQTLRPEPRQRQPSLATLREQLFAAVGTIAGDPAEQLANLVRAHQASRPAGRPMDRLAALQALASFDEPEDAPRQGTKPVWNDGGTEPTASSFSADGTAPITITKKVLRTGPRAEAAPPSTWGRWMGLALLGVAVAAGAAWASAGRREVKVVVPVLPEAQVTAPPPAPIAEPLPLLETPTPPPEAEVTPDPPPAEAPGHRSRRAVSPAKAAPPPSAPADGPSLWRRLERLSALLERRVSAVAPEQAEAWERTFLELQVQTRQAQTAEELQAVARELGALERAVGASGER